MIFKSRQVNLDPEPWYNRPYDRRFRDDSVHGSEWAPRPEFEPTRDPEPWVVPLDEFKGKEVRSIHNPYGTYLWAPRREQFDTPVNPILEQVRAYPATELRSWLLALDAPEYLRVWAFAGHTQEHVDHARKVLTRLANWKS